MLEEINILTIIVLLYGVTNSTNRIFGSYIIVNSNSVSILGIFITWMYMYDAVTHNLYQKFMCTVQDKNHNIFFITK